ncbi:hypothetical protein D6B99_16290 [Arachidicoccus soli]|uniref:Uncharacterized protein n=1 Tax=Arachidicoccus soli TaxID=2341117 RepID=A0A386HUH2_9BACT|nr:hypothetical protein D6B99_16290 [Arachidicoccus soli]
MAQVNYWNVPYTEALISHNKQNFSDNQQAGQKQLNLTSSELLVQTQKNKCKRLMDSLDKRLNSLYILAADVTLAVRVASIMNDLYAYQSDAFRIAFKYPYAAFMYSSNEVSIIHDAESLYALIALVVASYGDISKMKVSDRKIVYTQIIAQLQYLRAKCQSLNQLLAMVQYSDLYKNTHGWQFINMDKDKVQQILRDWKH